MQAFAADFRILAQATLLTLALAIGSTPAHAGLFDLLKPTEKPLVLTEQSDFAAAMSQTAQKPVPQLTLRDKTPPRLGISSFEVRYITDNSVSQTKRSIGIGQTREARASVQYQLEAPGPDVYQALTDGMQAQLRELLTARGYQLLSNEEMLADAEFAAQVAATPRAAQREPGFFSKSGEVLTFGSGTVDGGRFMMGMSDIKRAERLGPDVGFLKIILVVDFASLQEMGLGERISAGADAGVKAKVGLAIATEPAGNSPSQLHMFTSLGGVPVPLMRTIYLEQPIAKSVTAMGESTSEAAIGFLKALAGGGSKGARYKVTPADDYAEQMAAGLKLVARMLAEALPMRASAK
ncbi:hypothetical protein [Pelomonas sp. SE-A7]|uniref:hypothetical protein n=1 Tax=Pelomonas sp. SE-A7 TaxID=3054953 RepID=UPI00259C7156|nr:hypothetical protein [Pelomonas sp. SE-A7]MDM4767637.1 hypothetical protein [Pelomonas sp. SE-A7]